MTPSDFATNLAWIWNDPEESLHLDIVIITFIWAHVLKLMWIRTQLSVSHLYGATNEHCWIYLSEWLAENLAEKAHIWGTLWITILRLYLDSAVRSWDRLLTLLVERIFVSRWITENPTWGKARAVVMTKRFMVRSVSVRIRRLAGNCRIFVKCKLYKRQWCTSTLKNRSRTVTVVPGFWRSRQVADSIKWPS